jgi:hypothetical protein
MPPRIEQETGGILVAGLIVAPGGYAFIGYYFSHIGRVIAVIGCCVDGSSFMGAGENAHNRYGKEENREYKEPFHCM